MRYLLTPLLFLLFTLSGRAQVQINSSDITEMNHHGSLSEKDTAELRKTTTLFLLQQADTGRKADFERAIAAVWTITPFKVIFPDEWPAYRGRKEYSFFTPGYYIVEYTSSNGNSSTESIHYVYELWQNRYKNGVPRERHFYARFALGGGKVDNEMWPIVRARMDESARWNKTIDLLSRKADFYTWGPGMCKGFFRCVNDHLLTMDDQGILTEFTDKKGLQLLATDTLFVPSYFVDQSREAYKADAKDGEEDAAGGEVSESYPYPVRYVSTEELDRLVLTKTGPFCLLIGILSGSDKFVSVFDGSSGRMLYTRHSRMSQMFKKKDLGKLAKAIR